MSVYTLDSQLTDAVDRIARTGIEGNPQQEQMRPREEPMTELNLTHVDALETPHVIREMLARLPKLSESRLKEFEREFKLSYHFEGLTVALIPTKDGPAVVASGPDHEVYDVLDTLSPDQKAMVTLVDPAPLSTLAADLRPRSVPVVSR